MLERLRGAASATEPRTQRAIYEMGLSVMNPVLRLLEVYKHEVLVQGANIVITCYSDYDEVYILNISVPMVYYTLPVFKILAVGF